MFHKKTFGFVGGYPKLCGNYPTYINILAKLGILKISPQTQKYRQISGNFPVVSQL